MDDRTLLESAAKAVKRAFHWDGAVLVLDDPEPNECSAWNPLANDGDALRLAVKLEIVAEYRRQPDRAFAYHYGHNLEVVQKRESMEKDGTYAAMRRAIVRAAAEIGKQLVVPDESTPIGNMNTEQIRAKVTAALWDKFK